ncbi:MAG: sigma-70 family RNA polymerase sigma factor [Myxococcales bacterium]|nr:sigma-70 family RNA polymerase sigma factor [Myxococcales bacterium]
MGVSSEDPASIDAEALFRRHAEWAARYVTQLGFRGQDVEDIVQETFLVVHKKGGFRPGAAKPTTWLAEIAMRVGMAHRRSLRRAPISDEAVVERAPGSTADPLANTINTEALANTQRALDTLSLEQRALFVLFELEGEGCDALAVTFGVPIGTIYSRLHRARAEFLTEYRRLSSDKKNQRQIASPAP